MCVGACVSAHALVLGVNIVVIVAIVITLSVIKKVHGAQQKKQDTVEIEFVFDLDHRK